MKKIPTLILFIVLGLSGCSISSIHNTKALENINSYADAKQAIQEGMTMDQVRSKWGEPSSYSTVNNKTMWIYSQIVTNWGGKEVFTAAIGGYTPRDRKNVTVTFNTDNKVESVSYSKQKF